MKVAGTQPSSQEARAESGVSELAKSRKPMAPVKPWICFARSTSCHGIVRATDENEPRPFRIFWSIAVSILATGLLVSVVLISYEAFVIRGLQQESTSHYNETMALPDIYICDTALFNNDSLNAMGINSTMASYMALTLSPLITSHSLAKDHEYRGQLKEAFASIVKRVTLEEFFDKATLKCEDIILSCMHGVNRYNSARCCKDIFGDQTYVTDFATLCVSTHKQQRLVEHFPSQAYGLTVYLKTNLENSVRFNPRIISSNVAARRGITYAVSDPMTDINPTIATSSHYTWPGTWTGVSISHTRMDNTELSRALLSPHSCVHSQLAPDCATYSRRNCLYGKSKVWSEMSLECSLFRFKGNNTMPYCHPDLIIGLKANISTFPYIYHSSTTLFSECPEDCIVDEYKVTSSASPFDLDENDEMHVDHEHDDRVLHTAIHFYYNSFSFNIIKNRPTSLVKWFSDIGGNMSLFLGVSLVTLLEFLVLFVQCVFRFFSFTS